MPIELIARGREVDEIRKLIVDGLIFQDLSDLIAVR